VQTIDALYLQVKVEKEALDEQIAELSQRQEALSVKRDDLARWLSITSAMLEKPVIEPKNTLSLPVVANFSANPPESSKASNHRMKPMEMLRQEYKRTDVTFSQILKWVIEESPGLSRDALARKVYLADLSDADFKRAKSSLGSTLSDQANAGMWQNNSQKYYPAQ
jgi:hypothetical protein